MRKIGFHGGHTIYEIGPVSDVMLFFDCLRIHVEQPHPERDWSLLTDRLYRRYLRRIELDASLSLMELAREGFTSVPTVSGMVWDPSFASNSEKSWLDPSRATLADVFNKFFENFGSACASAKLFEESFAIYQPVRVVISDLAGYARDRKKPLSDYDALEGKPFWLR